MKKLLVAFITLFSTLATAQVVPYFPPPGMTYNFTTSQWGPIASMPSVATSTVVGNFSGSTGAPTALQPVALISMQNAVIAVDVIATSNLTLSGSQTIDGFVVGAGNFVLATGQTTGSQNGIWLVQTGAWVRPPNFPSGFVLPALCDITVIAQRGTAHAGFPYRLGLASAITIDTTSQTWVALGLGSQFPYAVITPTPTAGYCVSWTNANTVQQVTDTNGQTGPCAVENNNTGHIQLNNGGFPPSSSVGTINTNSSDHWGQVTGLSAATSIVITFANPWPNNIVSCVASDSVGSVIGVTYTSSAGTITAATFTPAAALTGSLSYLCFGTS